jgi:hypothetical protein
MLGFHSSADAGASDSGIALMQRDCADELMTSLTAARAAARAAAQAEWTVGQRTLARHRELQHGLGKQSERVLT